MSDSLSETSSLSLESAREHDERARGGRGRGRVAAAARRPAGEDADERGARAGGVADVARDRGDRAGHRARAGRCRRASSWACSRARSALSTAACADWTLVVEPPLPLEPPPLDDEPPAAAPAAAAAARRRRCCAAAAGVAVALAVATRATAFGVGVGEAFGAWRRRSGRECGRRRRRRRHLRGGRRRRPWCVADVEVRRGGRRRRGGCGRLRLRERVLRVHEVGVGLRDGHGLACCRRCARATRPRSRARRPRVDLRDLAAGGEVDVGLLGRARGCPSPTRRSRSRPSRPSPCARSRAWTAPSSSGSARPRRTPPTASSTSRMVSAPGRSRTGLRAGLRRRRLGRGFFFAAADRH